MTLFNDRLAELSAKISRKKQLENMIDHLTSEREMLERKVHALGLVKKDEQDDVDLLESRSLAAFFYAVIGKKNEKLDKEREEAYAAAVKYDAAVRELEAVKDDIWKYKDELSSLHGCEKQYDALLTEKAAVLTSSENETASEIFKCEELISSMQSRKKEIDEAISAGKTALATANSIISSMEDAEGYGTWDVFGGGLIADVLKHGAIDDAQEKIEVLQIQLRRFKTELVDVKIKGDISVGLDSFTKFADHFFDGLFMDLSVLDTIRESLDSVKDTHNQINRVLGKLETMLESTERQIDLCEKERKELILKAEI
ncbi:MAG: hypothetical protein IJF23_01715 [Clostridia bacterium]|nr:hypothetical protein [Clostridia bacterium]